MSVTCACATDLVSVENQACSQLDLGNQIVRIFIQKMEGSTFDGAPVVGSTGGDIETAADWVAKRDATGVDKIISIANLAGAVRESAEPNIEEGNDVPYDGVDVIDRPQTVTYDVKYIGTDTLAQLDAFVCGGKYRVWLQDNNDYVWVSETTNGDGILDVSVLMNTLGQGGIGTKNKVTGNVLRWNNLCQPYAYGTKLSFLKNFETLT